MCKAYVDCIKVLRLEKPKKNIYLFSSELTDMSDINTVYAFFENDEFVQVKNIDSKEALFSLYETVDIVLAARMHTVITSIVSEVPVISIAWQQKVASVMELLDLSDYNYSVDDFSLRFYDIAQHITRCINDPSMFLEKIKQRLSQIKSQNKKYRKQ